MANNGAYRIHLIGARPSRRPNGPPNGQPNGRPIAAALAHTRARSGRHRLGHPGLHHCRDLRPVHLRLATGRLNRHAAPVSPAQFSAQLVALVLLAVIAGTVLVSGWYAAAGAAVIADIVAP
jgi:hypothetical protein